MATKEGSKGNTRGSCTKGGRFVWLIQGPSEQQEFIGIEHVSRFWEGHGRDIPNRFSRVEGMQDLGNALVARNSVRVKPSACRKFVLRAE